MKRFQRNERGDDCTCMEDKKRRFVYLTGTTMVHELSHISLRGRLGSCIYEDVSTVNMHSFERKIR
jgi:hypothetical protein